MSVSEQDDRYDELDARFAAAATDLRSELAGSVTPDFTPRRSGRPMLLAAAVTIAVVVAGVVALRPGGDDTIVTAPESTQLPESGSGSSSGVDTTPDPDFGVAAVRVSSAGDDEYVLPVQSPASAWNADGSRLLLYRTTSGGAGVHRLYDVGPSVDESQPRASGVDLDISPSDIEQVFWSPVDPDVFLFASGNELVAFDVASMSLTVVRTFDGCDSVDPGAGTGPSWDGELMGLLCVGEVNQLISYRLATDEVVVAPTNGDEAPLALPSGSGFLLPVDGAPDRVLGIDLAPTGVSLDLDNAARSLSIVEGVDVVIGPSFDAEPGSLVVYPVDGSPVTVVLGAATGFPTVAAGASYSSTAWLAPGRVVVAVPGDVGDAGDPSSELAGRIVAVDLTTGEFADVGAHLTSGRIDYWSDTFVSIDPTGTRIAFSTDLGAGVSVDTYVAEID